MFVIEKHERVAAAIVMGAATFPIVGPLAWVSVALGGKTLGQEVIYITLFGYIWPFILAVFAWKWPIGTTPLSLLLITVSAIWFWGNVSDYRDTLIPTDWFSYYAIGLIGTLLATASLPFHFKTLLRFFAEKRKFVGNKKNGSFKHS